MHNTIVIVFSAKCIRVLQLPEVGFVPGLNIVPNNFHIVVPVLGALHVKESQCMNEFMNDCALSHTTATRLLDTQVQYLRLSLVTYLRETPRFVALYENSRY